MTAHATKIPLPLRILVVEDMKVYQLLASNLLAKDGHDVTVMENGLQAVEAIKEGLHVDVILMDVEMPVMDGLTATAHIRRTENGAKRQLIIALTATANPEQCKAAGMDAYLPKPLAIPALYEVLEHCSQHSGPNKPR